MIKVVLLRDNLKSDDRHEFYVRSSCFYRAEKAARARAEKLGVDLSIYSSSAMTQIEVLREQAI